MLAWSGGDPLSEKRRVQEVPTFAEAAQRVLEQKRGGCRGRWHAQNWWRSMERYVFPWVGSRTVSEVNTADVLEILSPIWHVKAATAREVSQCIRSVLEWAIALDMSADNPCDRVVPVLGPAERHCDAPQALPHKDVAAAIETVRGATSPQPAVKLAFELLVLTAARSGEVRLATWDEMDVAGRVWTVPALRMKAKREHRVPLCGRALEILDAARALGDGSGLVSPMRSGRPISPSTLPKMLQYHEIAARGSRLPLVVPGLGGGHDLPSAGGDRGGARSRRPEQGRGGLRAVGLVRAAAEAHGRLGGLRQPHRTTAALNDGRTSPQ